MSFTQEIVRFSANSKGKIQQARKAITFELFASVISDSPVDTGRFRGNWNLSEGTPDKSTKLAGFGADNIQSVAARGQSGEKLAKKDFDDASAADASKKISEIGKGVEASTGERSVFLTNSLPYAVPLEMGSSKQAPEGMVRKNLARIAQIVRAQVSKIRNTRGGARDEKGRFIKKS